jgi:hypothetical protein
LLKNSVIFVWLLLISSKEAPPKLATRTSPTIIPTVMEAVGPIQSFKGPKFGSFERAGLKLK